MKHILLYALLLCAATPLLAQTASIQGQLQDTEAQAVAFANVALYELPDSNLVKVEVSDESGIFRLQNLSAGNYYVVSSFVGYNDLQTEMLQLEADKRLDLEVLKMQSSAIALEGATVTARRAMVEIKPDRTVFNVQGTINSIGSDAISLLRKAPGVNVDNNDNISVLGRAGVLLYVDGKRLPLSGQELSNYLQSLPAEQIDRIDIITNPGAKYEAEGNAGIIDIRLKKDKNLGTNGSANATYSQGRYTRANTNASANYRNKGMNVFANAGIGRGKIFNNMDFINFQNGLRLQEETRSINNWNFASYRLGTDFFLGKKHTIGFLVDGRTFDGTRNNNSRTFLAQATTPNSPDSILVALNRADDSRFQNAFNVNYRFDNAKGRTLNIDLDYGNYQNDSERFQPNQYFDPTQQSVLTEVINTFDTPTDIDILTGKIDFEENILGGVLGIGSKVVSIVSDNTFLVFDVFNGNEQRNDRLSNLFEYTENVYAGYINFARPITETINFSGGLRAEQTDAQGLLSVFQSGLEEDPVDLNYLSWFPSAGLTWQVDEANVLSLNYGRRINRPDYNVLNPFNDKQSEISFQKGNPFLQPEIVNNVEIGYTLGSRYNFKLAYSKTSDQITRLIAPDEEDPRANFITWENLAEQTTISFNASAPIQVTPKWNSYVNLNAFRLDNQADYGDGAIVDVQAFSYNIFQQSTFDLPWSLQGEISGYFSGPGVWGGVFRYESNWSLNVGLQRRFLNEQLNVRLSADDLFYQTGWDGESEFNGLRAVGSGRWDSRRVSLSLSYSFGNQNVQSRRRKSGLEEEAGRVGN
jgi:outer membrane receptor protein involved in Fe transport